MHRKQQKFTHQMIVLYEDLTDKNVLVTGGASGLRYAIARAFAGDQCNVVIVGRNREKLSQARKELGKRVTSLSLDLSRIDQLPALIRQIKDAVRELHVLVNSAGVNQKKAALTVSDQEYENIIRTNQTAVFALTREVAKSMIRRRSERRNLRSAGARPKFSSAISSPPRSSPTKR